MSETLIAMPGRNYEIFVKLNVEMKGDRANFLADAEKIKASLAAAFDEAIEKAGAN
jgi:hypothetical protein